MPSHQPRRSVLYVPGANARALAKAARLPADGLILDLEDAVLPEAKIMARRAVMDAVSAKGFGPREVVVRVNGLDTAWGADDLRAAAACPAHAILLPKVDDPDTVREAVALLEQHGAPASLRIWVMAETPRGIENAAAITGSHPRLEVMVMGTADLAKALRLPEDPARTGLLHALSRCVLAARLQGLDILDGVFTNLDDEPGFRAACLSGRFLGFDGKTLIHPGQIGPANEIFGVSDSTAGDAARVVAAWEAAVSAGSGVAVVAGRMIERLHAEEARRLLALHAAARRDGHE